MKMERKNGEEMKNKENFINSLNIDPKPQEYWDLWYGEFLEAREKGLTHAKKVLSNGCKYARFKDDYFFRGRPYCLTCFKYCNLEYKEGNKDYLTECCKNEEYELDHWNTPREKRQEKYINNLNGTIKRDLKEVDKLILDIDDYLINELGEVDFSPNKETWKEVRKGYEYIDSWIEDYEQ